MIEIFCNLIFKGDVIDANTSQPIENATLTIQGNTKTVRTTQNGEFWRLLTPGYYNISASATGYNQSPWIQVLVSENEAIYQQIELERIPLGIEISTGSTESTPGSTDVIGRSESTTGNPESSTGITESIEEPIIEVVSLVENQLVIKSSTGSTESPTGSTESTTGSTESADEPILEVVS